MYWPNLKSVALPVPEIIRSTQKIWAVPVYAHAPFSPKIFNGLLFGWTLLLFWPNLKFVALPIPEIIVIGVLGRGCEAVGGRRGSGMVPLERALVTSYRPSIVTFPISLRVSDMLPLLCSSTPLFSHPTSTLPKISPFSSSRWMAFGLPSAKVLG